MKVLVVCGSKTNDINLLNSCHLNRCLVVRGHYDVNRFASWETFKLFEAYCRIKYSLHSVKIRTALLKNCVEVKSFPGNSTLDVFFVDFFFRFLFYLFITSMHNLYFYWKTLCKCSFGRSVVIEQRQYTHTHNKKTVKPFKVIFTEIENNIYLETIGSTASVNLSVVAKST